MRASIVAAVVSVLPGVAAGQPNQTIAVLDLADKGAGDTVAKNISDVVTAALTEIGLFDVLSRADIQRMLEFESEKQAIGCESDTSCLAEIGGALGVALLVNGSVGRVGDSWILNLGLTDTREGRVLERVQRKYSDLNELTDDAPGATRFLVRGLLAGRQGGLLVEVSESSAEIELDGKLVGLSPFPRQTVAGGPHRLEVSKKGFITWSKDVDVEPGDLTVVDVGLIPSVEFIEEYEANAFRWRLGAYLAGGVGAAAVGFGAYTYLVYNANRADTLNREIEAAGCSAGTVGQPTVDCDSAFADRRSSIRTWDSVAVGALLGGVAALGAGIYLFAAGPTPGVYDKYGTGVTVAAAPLPGGGLVGARFEL